MSSWQQLQKHGISEDEIFRGPTRINQDEFIVTIDRSKDCIIRKYHTRKQKWSMIHSFDEGNASSHSHRSFYDDKTNSVYILTSNQLSIIDLDSMTTRIQKVDVSLSRRARMCMVDEYLHAIDIGGHTIFDTQKNKEIGPKRICNILGLTDGELVYLQTKNILLHFGGFDGVRNTDIDSIHQWSMIQKEWIRLEVGLFTPLTSFCCIQTNDDKYIFVLGGRYYDGDDFNDDPKNDISIFDVEQKKIWKSNIKLPDVLTEGICGISMLQNNQLLINGYIRTLDQMIPTDIIQVIKELVWIEYLYIMKKFDQQQNFWTIPVDDILYSK